MQGFSPLSCSGILGTHWIPNRSHSEVIRAVILARAWRNLGRVGPAERLDEETFANRRTAFGVDDPDTLVSANNLATDLRLLGDVEAARRLDEETLIRWDDWKSEGSGG